MHVKLLAQCRVLNLPGRFFPLAEDEEGKEEQFFSDEDDAIEDEITEDAEESNPGRAASIS